MKKNLLVLLFALMLVLPVFASERTDEIEYLYNTVREIHPAIYTNISEAELNRAYTVLINKADKLSDVDYAVALSEFLALAGDGHTACGFSEKIYNQMNFLPVRLYDDGNKITIFAAEDEAIIGKEISEISGCSISMVIERMASLFSADTSVYKRYKAVNNLVVTDFLAYSGIVENADEAVTVKFTDGSRAIISPVGRDEYISATLKNNIISVARTLWHNEYYSLRMYDEEIYYFPYNTCASNPDFPVDTFINQVEAVIESTPPKALVIDLRANSGGNSSLLDPFISWLEKNIEKLGFRLFVLIGKDTFSSAVLNAEDLLEIEGAVSVGSETGGSANHFGEIRQFSLPYSGLSITVSSKLFGDRSKIGKGIVPDVVISNTYSDYISGRDRVYEYAVSETGR